MSILSREVQQEQGLEHVASLPLLLPRVNLLPPEIAERVVFRKVQVGLGAGVLAAAALVAVGYVAALGSVSSAQSHMDTATAQQSSIQSQSAKYRDVTAVYAEADAAQAQLTDAMGDEIRYSQLLNDLSLTVPGNVWLKSVTFTPPAGAAPGAVTAAGTAPVGLAGPVGNLAVTGVAFTHDDVAVWLDALAGLKTYKDPYFSSSTEGLIGNRKTVGFSSTATVLSTAQSGRYKKSGG